MARGQKTKKSSSGANLGFEEKLWQGADVAMQDLTIFFIFLIPHPTFLTPFALLTHPPNMGIIPSIIPTARAVPAVFNLHTPHPPEGE
jgi:hypothetical protein